MNKLLFEVAKTREICAIRVANRRVLADNISGMIDSSFFNGDKNKTYLHVELINIDCCGGSVDYVTEPDIPYHSVPCPCGNPKHWLIRYVEEE